MRKSIKILHPLLRPSAKYMAILPIGMYCNENILKAKSGDIVEFWQDWRHEKMVLLRKCKLLVKSSAFTFMAKSIYGEHTTISGMMKKWERQALNEGIGIKGFSRTEAVLIECVPLSTD